MEISKTELEVMQVIWKSFPVTADIVIENLNQTHIWHEKTVKTLLNRLIKKQALSYEKKGRQYAYYPLLEKNDYQIKETHSFVRRLFQGQISPLIASFAKHESLSKDDIEELKKLIKSWDEKND